MKTHRAFTLIELLVVIAIIEEGWSHFKRETPDRSGMALDSPIAQGYPN